MSQPDRPWETAPEALENAEKGQKTEKQVMFGCLGLVVAAITIAALSSMGSDDEGLDPAVERYDAERVCQDFVKDRLKSPSSAKFETDVTGFGPEYTVRGSVDSQNGFGAMVRNTFSCTVRGDGETWRLQSLTGLTS